MVHEYKTYTIEAQLKIYTKNKHEIYTIDKHEIYTADPRSPKQSGCDHCVANKDFHQEINTRFTQWISSSLRSYLLRSGLRDFHSYMVHRHKIYTDGGTAQDFQRELIADLAKIFTLGLQCVLQ